MSTVYLIDSLNHIFRAYHGLPPLSTTTGVPTGATYGVAKWFLSLVREHRPTHVAAVFEGKGRNFRKDLYPEYKSGRPPLEDDIKSQFNLTRRLFEALGVRIVEAPGYEADDAMASVARWCVANGHEVVICSADKDMMQLTNGRVRQLDPETGGFVTEERIMKKWGVRPGQIRDYLALAGDTIDHVPGVDGIGAVAAQDLLARFGTIEEIRKAENPLPKKDGQPSKKGEALAAEAADGRLDLWVRLVSLVDDLPLVASIGDLAWPGVPATADVFYREVEFFKLLSDGWSPEAVSEAANGPMYDANGRRVA